MDAQFQVGQLYEKWRGVLQSYKLAFYYYKLAANEGNPGSQYCLACLYEKGLGTKQDIQKALYYYKLSANQGSPSALSRLGEFYLEPEFWVYSSIA